MKEMISSVVILAIISITACSQTAKVKSNTKENGVPVVVLDAFKKDFSSGGNNKWSTVPAVAIGEEYLVSIHDDGKATFYTIVIRGTNLKGEAVYDANGVLHYSKELVRDTALPYSVVKAIEDKYPGYVIIKDYEKIKMGKSNFSHYKIFIENEKEKRVLAIDSDARILKERKVR
ncbi:MAG: hypothetical protein DI538_22240 [Azospira oryzae]|jgi:hypothetical protein|nr:MAG: hypothetical protein DI538_22240 [Azospira oryzae]